MKVKGVYSMDTLLYKLIIRNDLNKRVFYIHIQPYGNSKSVHK